MMNAKKIKSTVIASALVGCLAIGGISAYFTDGDTATNTFTVGKVEIDLQEPNWEPPTDITPGKEFTKNPKIKNDGINEAYTFAKVTVPYANIVVAEEDGSKLAGANTQLFDLLDVNGDVGVNDGWVLVGYMNADGELSDEVVYNADGNVVHLYAYGTNDELTKLAANATTPALFDTIRFCNVVEGQGLEETTKSVIVDAYAIQTENIGALGSDDAANADGKTSPEEVWAILAEQAPSTDVTKTEEPNTDIKQQ